MVCNGSANIKSINVILQPVKSSKIKEMPFTTIFLTHVHDYYNLLLMVIVYHHNNHYCSHKL